MTYPDASPVGMRGVPGVHARRAWRACAVCRANHVHRANAHCGGLAYLTLFTVQMRTALRKLV